MNEQVKKHIKAMFSRVWIILIIGILSAAIVNYSYTKNYVEKYEARVKLIIIMGGSTAQGASIFDSMRSSQMAVGDISQIITSEAVLTNVEKESGVSQTKISKALNINAIPNTRILDISVDMNTPQQSMKVIQSLNKNLQEKLKEVDSYLEYKILSKPHVDSTPINSSYPIFFTIAAALGGIILGGLINIILAELNIKKGNLNHVKSIFESESILPVPVVKTFK